MMEKEDEGLKKKGATRLSTVDAMFDSKCI
jgi:hypothetical protein